LKKAVLIFLALAMLCSVVACGGSGGEETPATPETAAAVTATPAPAPAETAAPPPASAGPQYGGVLRLVGNSTIEPFGVPWLNQTQNRPFAPWGEALVLETTSGEIKPWLAKSWDIDMEKLEIVFRLRDDVKFTDGSDFCAETAAWNINKWKEGGVLNPAIKGAEARGDYELAVLLNSYTNSIMGILASRVNSFISKESYEKHGEEWAMNNPVGTGPFKFKEKVSGYHVTFVRNENYWQEGLPYLDGIEYVELTDELAQNAALQSDGADYLDVLQTSSVTQILTMTAGDTGVRLVQAPLGCVALMPSSKDETSPLSKLEVRQAISYAIDRNALCKAFGQNFYSPALQLYQKPALGVLPDSCNLSYDPEKSRELLSKAGYPDGISITFYAPEGTDKDAMIAIGKMLGDVGIRCDMQFPNAAAAVDLRTEGWDGLYAATVRTFSNITTTFRMHFDPDYQYFPSTWRPEEMGRVFIQARSTKEVQEDLVAELHRMTLENLLCIPVYNTKDNYLIRENVHDAGFGEWGAGTQYRLDIAWKSAG